MNEYDSIENFLNQYKKNEKALRTAYDIAKTKLENFEKIKDNSDVRALQFCKSSLPNRNYLKYFEPKTDEEKSTRKEFCSYAAIGSSADIIQTYKLEIPDGESLLKAIYKDTVRLSEKLDGSLFVNPRYVIYNYEYDEKRIEDYKNFWQYNDGYFFFVSTYNMRNPVPDYNKRIATREKLNSDICNLREYNKYFSFLIYDSLDLLSDYVIIWKSRNIRSVMAALRQLYEKAKDLDIGHIKSACSVPYKMLNDEEDYKVLIESIAEEDSNEIPHVDYLNIRAVCNDYNALTGLKNNLAKILGKSQAHKKLNKGKSFKEKKLKQHFFVIGSTDYIGYYDGIDDKILCEYLKYLVASDEDSKIPEAITRIETTIGIDFAAENAQIYQSNEPDEKTKILENASKWLLDKIKEIFEDKENQEIFTPNTAPWKAAVLELYNQMAHMSKSCVYDSACFLRLDSFFCFYFWLNHVVYIWDDSKQELIKREKMDAVKELIKRERFVNDFIGGCMQLTDLIARALGNESHMPGYSPLLYHMSTAIVELCQAFFVQVSRFLRDLGDDAGREIFCFLVPDQYLSIETGEGFGETLDAFMMVQIKVPLELLSDPQRIIVFLTHESGHHYGLKELSERSLRLRRYMNALVFYIMQYTNGMEVRDLLQDFNYNMVLRWEHANIHCVQYIKEIINKKSAILKLPIDSSLEEKAKDLQWLFEECFPDLIMLEMLDLKENDGIDYYFKMVYLHEPELERLEYKAKSDINRLVMRLFIVCTTIGVEPDFIDLKNHAGIDSDLKGKYIEIFKKGLENLNRTQKTFEDKLNRLHNGAELEDNEGNEVLSDYFFPEVLDQIILYLKACLNGSDKDNIVGLKRKIQEYTEKNSNEKLANICKDFKAIKDDKFFNEEFYNIIVGYRNSIIENISEKMKPEYFNNIKF